MGCDKARRTLGLFLLWISIAVFGAGCGGGSGDSADITPPVSPSGPVSVLAWDPPTNYVDNVRLDPLRDLDHYEVYVRQDVNFSAADVPVAMIAALVDAPADGGTPAGRTLQTEFILENLEPYIPAGSRYYVSLKSVGIDGQKSDFMPAVEWDKL
jgi:hypothetical protein